MALAGASFAPDLFPPCAKMTSGAIEPGTVLDTRVEITTLLGEGASSFVYKARHRGLDREVAVKALHLSKISDKEAVLRFYREAKLISSLDHPNIVKVFAVGLTPQQQPYFVMEYIEGQPLEELIAQKAITSLSQFIDIFSQVCEALKHAHAAGVVHRDVKPSNIVLVSEDNKQTVKLVDFGIARFVGTPAVGQQNTLTREGSLLGTPAYMSPEQCLSQRLDARSDLYSLGCVMYHTLCGELPFVSATATDVVRMHLSEAAVPLKNRDCAFDAPQTLFSVVEHAMQKGSQHRYQSAEELLADLQAVAKGEPHVVASRKQASPSVEQRIARLETFRRYATVACAAFVTIVALSAFGIYTHSSAESKESLQLKAQELNNKAIVADHHMRWADASLYYGQAHAIYVRMNLNSRDFAELCYRRAVSASQSAVPEIRQHSNEYFAEALSRRKALNYDKTELARLETLWGEFCQVERNHDAAIEHFHNALAHYWHMNHEPPTDQVLLLLSRLVEECELSQQYDRAAQYASDLVATAKSCNSCPDNLARDYEIWARVLQKQGKSKEAQQQLQIANAYRAQSDN